MGGSHHGVFCVNAIRKSKIPRINFHIKVLGGILKAVKLMLKMSNNTERLEEREETLKLTASEILRMSLMADECRTEEGEINI